MLYSIVTLFESVVRGRDHLNGRRRGGSGAEHPPWLQAFSRAQRKRPCSTLSRSLRWIGKLGRTSAQKGNRLHVVTPPRRDHTGLIRPAWCSQHPEAADSIIR